LTKRDPLRDHVSELPVSPVRDDHACKFQLSVDIGEINGVSTTVEVCMCPKSKKKFESVTCGEFLEIVRTKYNQYIDLNIGKHLNVA